MALLVKNLPAIGRPGFDPWVGKIPWRREWLLASVFWHGEFHGLYSPWGWKETQVSDFHFFHFNIIAKRTEHSMITSKE